MLLKMFICSNINSYNVYNPNPPLVVNICPYFKLKQAFCLSWIYKCLRRIFVFKVVQFWLNNSTVKTWDNYACLSCDSNLHAHIGPLLVYQQVDLQLMCNWEKSGGLKFKFVLTLSNFINNESNNLELEYV